MTKTEHPQLKQISWAGFNLQVPGAWEVGRHSHSFRQGTLVLFGRRRQRMELSWRTCEKVPDVQRSCQDLRERLVLENGVASCSDSPLPGGWHGFRRKLNTEWAVIHALHWGGESKRLVQATIVEPEKKQSADLDLASVILNSFQDAGTQGKPIQWQAFGISCQSPPGWKLVSSQIKPMDVQLHFSQLADGEKGSGKAGTATVQRLGMAGTWYKNDAKSYLRECEPNCDFVFKEIHYNSHQAVAADAEDEMPPYLRILGRRRVRKDLIWLCEKANAVYRVTTATEASQATVTPQVFVLQCHSPGQSTQEKHIGL